MSEAPRPNQRGAAMDTAVAREYDLIVIGGGINGAGVARNAALRGLSVALFEARDFGFGTTWRSTKLIHGGLRYLEHREFRLVFEGLHERAILLRIAPHLVQPQEFLLPAFRGGRYGRRMLQAGLSLYDLLSVRGGLPRHRSLPVAQAMALEPALNGAAITGAFQYYDGHVPLPERLCWENLRSAIEAGAQVFNHAPVVQAIRTNGRLRGVAVQDAESGTTYEFRGRVVINAAGPWVDSILQNSGVVSDRIGGTKGVHLVVDWQGAGPRRALYAEAGADGRPFFVIPWRGRHLIGTTDSRFTGDAWEARPEPADIAYLMREVERLLPGAPLAEGDVLYSYAGVRPLPRAEGHREGAITRRHFIEVHRGDGVEGLVTIIGGKLTSYRALAEQTVRIACRELRQEPGPDPTRDVPLVPDPITAPASPLAAHLLPMYGGRSGMIEAMARLDGELREPLCPHGPDVAAQAVYAIRQEQARTVADVLLRRTPAGWNRCRGIDAAPVVARLLGRELGWDAPRVDAAVRAYQAEVDATLYPVVGATPADATQRSRQ